jgi:hypothetical protein
MVTEYLIFFGGEHGWQSIGKASANSAHNAIRARLGELPASEGGTYVAVPARSWKPVTVEAVQTTVLKFS